MTDEPVAIPKWAWMGLAALLALLVLGVSISPRDQANRPILFLPDTKAVEDYHASIASWHTQMQALDAEIATLLSGEFGSDLFSQSRAAQKAVDAAIRLAQEIDRQAAPMAAIAARTLLRQAASAYLDAARAMLQWVTTPNAKNLAVANQALGQARQARTELEQSQWIKP